MNKNLIKKLKLNRPFEFRVWHTPSKSMHYGVTFTNDLVYLPWDESKADAENYKVVDHPFKREECILMQYSGVGDCKRAKIWEGDILYWACADESIGLLFKRYKVVIFGNGTFGTEGDKYEPIEALCRGNELIYGNGLHFERVVGNIFQHAHLLGLSGEYPIPKCQPKKRIKTKANEQASANNLATVEN